MIQALEAAKVAFDNGTPSGEKETFTEFASTCESAYLAALQVAERSAGADPSRAAYATQDANALKAASVKFSELAGRPTSLSRETPVTSPTTPTPIRQRIVVKGPAKP